MTDNSQTVVLAVLRAVGARGAGYGFERPAIEGYSPGQIDAAVDELRRDGNLVAAFIPAAFGDNPAHWAPSELTVPGRHLLEELERSSS